MGSIEEIRPPFTENWVLTGPRVAISCIVDFDREQESYVATSSSGFRGAGNTEIDAALMCFTAWMTNRRGWYVS